MLESGGEPDLALEPLGAECGSELGAEALDGDRPVVLAVASELHRRHASVRQLPLERVRLGQFDSDGARRLSHGSPVEGTWS